MDLLILVIYAAIVYFLVKKKILPWNFVSASIIITLPIVAIVTLILLLNVYAPSSSDARVINYVVQIVPRVTGRVVEVPVEPNLLVKKGDVLFKIDPAPFQFDVNQARAQLALSQAAYRSQSEELKAAQAQVGVASNRVDSFKSAIDAARSKLTLSQTRLTQTKKLAEAGAGDQFDAERYDAEVAQGRADLAAGLTQVAAAQQEVASANAKVAALQQQLAARVNGEPAQVALIRSQMEQAEWKLAQTTTYAPTDGYVVNLQLRPGSTASQLPLSPVMTFVEPEQWIIALFDQNELHEVAIGNEAEVSLETYPGRIIKCKVDAIIWAQGQGQLPLTGTLPQTVVNPPDGRFPVKLKVDDKDKDLFLAAGARGHAAIYSEHFAAIHLVRKVLIRFSAFLDWLVLKAH